MVNLLNGFLLKPALKSHCCIDISLIEDNAKMGIVFMVVHKAQKYKAFD